MRSCTIENDTHLTSRENACTSWLLEIGRAPDDEEAPMVESLARSESPGVVRYNGPTAWSLIQGVARSGSSSLRASAARSRSAHYDTWEGRALQR